MIGTSYFEIYKRAVIEFKDPTLKNLLEHNTVLFSETMYNFLENAISLFTTPQEARKRVRDRVEPYTLMANFECDGEQNTFIFPNAPDNIGEDDIICSFTMNGEIINGDYNIHAKTVTVEGLPPIDADLSCELYYIGRFNCELNEDEKYILSQFIVACWSEFIVNDMLDLTRLLEDTDFKLTSNATTTNAKTSWGVTTIERVNKRMAKYSWDCQYSGVYK